MQSSHICLSPADTFAVIHSFLPTIEDHVTGVTVEKASSMGSAQYFFCTIYYECF